MQALVEGEGFLEVEELQLLLREGLVSRAYVAGAQAEAQVRVLVAQGRQVRAGSFVAEAGQRWLPAVARLLEVAEAAVLVFEGVQGVGLAAWL